MTERSIAIIVEISHASAREKLRGILAFIAESGVAWRIDHEPRRLENGPPEWLRHWRGDGIIARSHCAKTVAAILETGAPAVELLGVARHPSIPQVISDERAIGSDAAAHLVSLGLQSFAFVGAKGMYWSENRRGFFCAAIAAAGHDCPVFEFVNHQRSIVPPSGRLTQLAAWLRRQPRPLGIMAANDQYAGYVAAACHAAGLAVPNDVAIIGVDNDEVFCELATPPLTSVAADHFAAGREAARLLAAMLDGRGPRRPGGRGAAGDWVAIRVPPRGIVERRSTELLAGADEDVAKALQLIRERFRGPLHVQEIVAEVGLSWPTLAKRFKKATGRGLHDEITAARIREARKLLSGTDLSLTAVADRSGLSSQQQMTRAFREHVGQTPAAYRAANRRRS